MNAIISRQIKTLLSGRIILVAFLLMLCISSLQPGARVLGSAASRKNLSSNDNWHTYTNANYIDALAIESNNVIWAGTRGGLVQWNQSTGDYQKYFSTANGLPGNVTAIVLDTFGNKWFGTTKGASKFNGTTWTTYTTANGLVNNSISDIALDGSGNLWFTTLGGVSKFDGSTWTSFTTSNSGLIYNNVTAVAIDGNDKWFGTYGQGISKFNGSAWTNYVLGNGDWIQNMINDIAIAPNGVKWFGAGNPMGSSGGGGGSLTRFDGTTWTSYSNTNSGLKSPYVFSVAVDNSGTVWAGTEGGVSSFDETTWTSYITTDGLVENWVTSVVVNGNSLWFGTNGGGISYFDRSKWTTYQTKDGLPSNTIYSIGANGTDLWFCGGDSFVITSHSGVTKFDGANWTHYKYLTSGLTMPEVYAIVPDQNGLLWFGGWDINTFNGTNWVKYVDPYEEGIVRAMAIDGNAKWFYTEQPFGSSRWVSKFDGTTWSAYTTGNSGLVSTPVNAIAIGKDHSKWFGTNNGVSKFDGTTWTTYTTANGLVNNVVHSIVVDQAGMIWFGTDSGVSKFDGMMWTNYTTANGLANNKVNSIAIDQYGTIWFGTDGGVSRLDGSSWTTYNTSNSGLVDNGVLDVVINASGHKWFNTSSGVSEFYTVPTLNINYALGAPGSYFNLTGNGFPYNQTATISINGHTMGTIVVDSAGTFTFTLSTSNANEGNYYVTASVNPSANVKFVLDNNGGIRSQEGSFPPFAVPAMIAFTNEVYIPQVKR